jgi:hypothetical protein
MHLSLLANPDEAARRNADEVKVIVSTRLKLAA